MYISLLQLKDFRNYGQESVAFGPFVNLVMGENAQGKTNLLEAVYLAAVGRSARTAKDKELIRWECDRAKIKVTATKSYGSDTVELVLDKCANKRIAVGGLPLTRIGELMGVVQAVFFSPDEMRLVKDGPGERRRFMDIALSQISRAYFYLLTRYNRIVSQRNRLIKSGQATGDGLDVWDSQLADSGALIIKTRRGFVTALSSAAREQHLFLSDGREALSLTYESVDGGDKDEIKTALLEALKADREKDIRLGYTHSGPHKDDIGIYIDGADARKFGSQGQQRTAALSIKLAEVELAAKERGETPVLLLDDVMGELDLTRQRKLLERIRGLQAIITCTHLDADIIKALGEHKVFTVKQGSVVALA